MTLNPKKFPRTRVSLIQALGERADSSAWREFFQCYAPAVYRVAALRGLQKIDAEDIVQEVMLAIAKKISSFEYRRDRGRFRDWVRRITDNKIVSHWRGNRKKLMIDHKVAADEAVDQTTIDKYWNEQWELQDLEYCRTQISMRISPMRLAAFRMYVLNGVSAADTAAQLNIQVGYVYVIRNQILNMIKDEMRKLERAENDCP